MKIYAREVKKILRTLPIGYYLGKNYPVSLDEEAECSFFNPTEQRIVISFKQIAEAMKELDRADFEMEVRANLYHELSHVILTPQDLKVDDIVNVFEDERIENYFADYYKEVDFKKSIMRECHYHGEDPDPNDPFQVFFYAMRFRHGTPEQLNWVERMIGETVESSICASDIFYCAKKAWEGITRTPYPTTNPPKTGKSSISCPKQGSGESNVKPLFLPSISDKNVPSRKRDSGKECLKDAIKWRMGTILYGSGVASRNLNFYKKASILFEGFNKRTNDGNAFCAYSGMLNPRNADRMDCRFFDRRASNRGVNKFGKVHVNLFLDVSGSFRKNQNATNAILQELATLEKEYSYFSFDVIACGNGEEKKAKSQRYIICTGGNNLDNKIYEIYRQVQLPNCVNYNIILFDGDAYPQKDDKGKTTFGAFNHENCFLISENQNRGYIRNSITKAKVVFSIDYLKELEENLLNALRLALQ